jgi:8-oxo-dGTP pyrophosphatase MutT (NUDIX family)
VDAIATALREAEEEIGLHAHHVDVLGSLPHYTTGSGFVVTPVVALIDPPFTVQPDPFEVAEVFEVPLAFLMAPVHHRRHAVEAGGALREFFSMPWESVAEPQQRYLGRDRGNAAQLLPLPVGLSGVQARRGARYDLRA